MRFTKVGMKNGRIHLEWRIERENGEPDEVSLKCTDEPAPEFKEAWDGLRQVIIAEAELPDGLAAEITPVGLSISHYKDDRWGAVVTGTRRLKHSHSPLVINTPHKPADPAEGNETDTCVLLDSSIDAIEAVLLQAGNYATGERAQQNLFAGVAA